MERAGGASGFVRTPPYAAAVISGERSGGRSGAAPADGARRVDEPEGAVGVEFCIRVDQVGVRGGGARCEAGAGAPLVAQGQVLYKDKVAPRGGEGGRRGRESGAEGGWGGGQGGIGVGKGVVTARDRFKGDRQRPAISTRAQGHSGRAGKSTGAKSRDKGRHAAPRWPRPLLHLQTARRPPACRRTPETRCERVAVRCDGVWGKLVAVRCVGVETQQVASGCEGYGRVGVRGRVEEVRRHGASVEDGAERKGRRPSQA
mmetsp:Transcript_4135/g.12807  ORF Transcript_4135/g.12807 Transcript_4135/m.12807 type:complete len:259 (+) Transcript_4135:588-1364(+)